MSDPLPPPAAADLAHILAHSEDLWRDLRGTRLFITGATGFFGKWLLESIAVANDSLKANVRATLLTRDRERFAQQVPRLADRAEFEWLQGDCASFRFPAGKFEAIIHLATPPAAELAQGGPRLAVDTLFGMQRLLDFARHAKTGRVLLASSGAVYGWPAMGRERIDENYVGSPNPRYASSAYGEVKRMCELLCALAPAVETVIARGFSFVGPYLPLTDKFAVGSFMGDALAGQPIRIRSDGSQLRSYLYAADLALWLLVLLVRGKASEAYNVGSAEAISLGQLARELAALAGTGCVTITDGSPPAQPVVYLPSIDKIRAEFALPDPIPLRDALRRTLLWAGSCPRSL